MVLLTDRIHPTPWTRMLRAAWGAIVTCLLFQTASSHLIGSNMALKRLSRSAVPNTARFTKPYRVCTSPWEPMVNCDHHISRHGLDPANFTGYQIALWREIAADLGLNETHDWTFTCMGWSDMMEDLIDPAGNCTLAAAGVELSSISILAGVKFAWPFYQDGLQVLVSSHITDEGIWGIFMGFHWNIWLMIPITSMSISIVLTWVELSTYSTPNAHGTWTKIKGFHNWRWYIHTVMIQQEAFVGDPRTWASRLLVLGWGFQMLLLTHLFTASTIMRLPGKRVASPIRGIEDLAGLDVGTRAPYVPVLRRYGVEGTAVPWAESHDQQKLLQKLRNGDVIERFQFGIAFPPTAPDDFVGQVSAAILRLQSNYATLDSLDKDQIRTYLSEGHACTEAISLGTHNQGLPQITTPQVAALWYLLLILTAISLALALEQRRRHNARVHAAKDQVPREEQQQRTSFDLGASLGTLHGDKLEHSIPGYLRSFQNRVIGAFQSSPQTQLNHAGELGNSLQLAHPGPGKLVKAPSFSLDASVYLGINSPKGRKPQLQPIRKPSIEMTRAESLDSVRGQSGEGITWSPRSVAAIMLQREDDNHSVAHGGTLPGQTPSSPGPVAHGSRLNAATHQ